MQTQFRTPYRIVVFASAAINQLKRSKNKLTTETRNYAYMGWNRTQHYKEARLPNAGSFLYPGLFAVRKAAMEFLALPETCQVSIRTDQDKQVYRFFKSADGTISGY